MDDWPFNPLLLPVMIFMLPVIAMLGGFTFLIVRTTARARLRELEIRERIALIERGLVPAPEVDPRGFERAMTQHSRVVVVRRAPARSRSAGVVFIGLGSALMFLIGFAGGAPGAAVGVGGAIIIIGCAFLLNGVLAGGTEFAAAEPRYVAPPVPATAPPPAQSERRPE